MQYKESLLGFSLTSLSSSSSDSNEKPTYHQNVLTDYPIFSAVTGKQWEAFSYLLGSN